MADKLKNVVLLGATGTIGANAARELAEHPESFRTVGVAGNRQLDLLADTATRLGAEVVITGSDELLPELRAKLPAGKTAASGIDAMCELVSRSDVDVVLCAIIGTAGIKPVLTALEAGKTVALASKEVLCLAGKLVMETCRRNPKAALVPVDSEHSGLFQCLQGRRPGEVERLILTASGGPFRTWDRARIARATVAEALAHPVWKMGKKITVDSATMMNKALEVIEASFLFGFPPEKLDVLVHPQSVVHALIELRDHTLISQLSVPDMRLAIRYGLSWPERLPGDVPALALDRCGALEFFPVDAEKFPAIKLAKLALETGGTMPCVLNAANEVAVEAFLSGQLPFGRIAEIVRTTMESCDAPDAADLETILEIDRLARMAARAQLPEK